MKIFSFLFFSFSALFLSLFGYDNECPPGSWYDEVVIGSEWLYWKAEQSCMDFGVSTETASAVRLSILSPHFKTQDGYRVYASYEIPECWTLDGAYVHIPSFGRRFISTAGDNFIQLERDFVLFTPLDGVTFSSAAARWKMEFNYVDFTVSRQITFCRQMNICPYLGFRGFWMQQRFGIDASGAAETILTVLKEKANGYGFLGGLYGDWQVGCGFSLIGEIGGSILYANREVRGLMLSSARVPYIYKKGHNGLTPMLNAFVGIQYAFCFGCIGDYEIHAGWENHILFFSHHFTSPEEGSLSLQGLTLGASVAF